MMNFQFQIVTRPLSVEATSTAKNFHLYPPLLFKKSSLQKDKLNFIRIVKRTVD